jgi:hypothetical protein
MQKYEFKTISDYIKIIINNSWIIMIVVWFEYFQNLKLHILTNFIIKRINIIMIFLLK